QAFGGQGYAADPYDTSVTQVFEPGTFGADRFAEAHTAATGQIPVFEEDFGRPTSSRIDFGPHEAFGPPPEDVPEAEPDDSHIFTLLRRTRSHAQQRRSKRWVAVLLVILLLGAAAAVRFAPFSPWRRSSATEDAAVQTAMPFHDAQFTAADLGTDGFLS